MISFKVQVNIGKDFHWITFKEKDKLISDFEIIP